MPTFVLHKMACYDKGTSIIVLPFSAQIQACYIVHQAYTPHQTSELEMKSNVGHVHFLNNSKTRPLKAFGEKIQHVFSSAAEFVLDYSKGASILLRQSRQNVCKRCSSDVISCTDKEQFGKNWIRLKKDYLLLSHPRQGCVYSNRELFLPRCVTTYLPMFGEINHWKHYSITLFKALCRRSWKELEFYFRVRILLMILLS